MIATATSNMWNSDKAVICLWRYEEAKKPKARALKTLDWQSLIIQMILVMCAIGFVVQNWDSLKQNVTQRMVSSVKGSRVQKLTC